MPLKKILRILILAEIILGLLSLAAEVFEEGVAPSPNVVDMPDVTLDYIGTFGAILCLVGIIVGWIGLWRLWRPARTIYTLSWILGPTFAYLVLRLSDYQTPLEAFFSGFSSVAAGMILGLTYFSDLATHFKKSNAEQVGSSDGEGAPN